MRRRDFILGLGGAAAAWPLAAHAQSSSLRVGWVTTAPLAEVSPFLDALRGGLAERGYTEGRNLTLFVRSADGNADRIVPLANELIRLPVDLIATQGPATRQLVGLNAGIPVVYVYSADPVIGGIADSFAHPGRNATGICVMAVELNGKRLELLREFIPQLRRVAIVASPMHPGEDRELANSEETAKRLGITIQHYPTPGVSDLQRAYASIAADPPQAIIAFPDPITHGNRSAIVEFANSQRIPVISAWAEFADTGALCTYGPKLPESYRRLAYYIDRIVKGENPATLPIELPTVIELVINLKAARTLGIPVVSTLLARADRVIE